MGVDIGMRGVRALSLAAVACLATSVVSSFTALPASADEGSGAQATADQLTRQLQGQQQQLNELARDTRQAQATVDRKNQELQTVAAQEASVRKEMQDVARVEYQRPAMTMSTILQARNLDQLISSVAQAKLVANKEEALHRQAKQLREKEAAARSQAAAQLSKISADRNQAAQVVQQTQATVQAAQAEAGRAAQAAQAQAVASRAQSLNQVAQTAAAAPGSIQQIIVQSFQPLGQAAVDWGLRIAKCESGYNPNAINPSGAAGLFQFMPSTFRNTPPGRAGGSIWDPSANAQAAAWMYSQGRQGEWECN
jgi:soluble lytic murein transglycosylase-like protein